MNAETDSFVVNFKVKADILPTIIALFAGTVKKWTIVEQEGNEYTIAARTTQDGLGLIIPLVSPHAVSNRCSVVEGNSAAPQLPVPVTNAPAAFVVKQPETSIVVPDVDVAQKTPGVHRPASQTRSGAITLAYMKEHGGVISFAEGKSLMSAARYSAESFSPIICKLIEEGLVTRRGTRSSRSFQLVSAFERAMTLPKDT